MAKVTVVDIHVSGNNRFIGRRNLWDSPWMAVITTIRTQPYEYHPPIGFLLGANSFLQLELSHQVILYHFVLVLQTSPLQVPPLTSSLFFLGISPITGTPTLTVALVTGTHTGGRNLAESTGIATTYKSNK